MSNAAANKEDLVSIAERMTAFFQGAEGQQRLRDRIRGRGMMFSPQLLQEIEDMQRDMLKEWGFEPVTSLQNLQGAVRRYPEMRGIIMGLCDVEERVIDTFQTDLAKEHNIELPLSQQGGHGSHGHDCNAHGHSHGGGHGHSHGDGQECGGHGHSHGGGMSGPPGSGIGQQIAMALVQKSLTREQLDFMKSVQTRVMQGQMPSGDDQLRAMQLQQTMMRKMANMVPMVQNGMEALSDDERKQLIDIEQRMMQGQQPSEQERKAVQAAQDNIATYIAMMGPMLAQMRQQQQQQQQPQSQAPSIAPPSSPPQDNSGNKDKKKD
jgi:hypothetical protein